AFFFFFQAEDGIRDGHVTGVQTCALPISSFAKDAAYWANDAAGRVNLATGAGGSGRQTGSAFKAFALVTALEQGISPDTTFAARSEERRVGKECRSRWSTN